MAPRRGTRGRAPGRCRGDRTRDRLDADPAGAIPGSSLLVERGLQFQRQVVPAGRECSAPTRRLRAARRSGATFQLSSDRMSLMRSALLAASDSPWFSEYAPRAWFAVKIAFPG